MGKPTQLPTVGKQFSLVPTSLGEAIKYAEIVSRTALVPKGLVDQNPKITEANVLAAVQMGMEVGLSPMQAIQNIAVINGLPSIWGDAMVAICQAHPLWAGIEQTYDTETMVAVCTVKRKGADDVTRQFSWSDAERAKLTGKSTYQQYPQRMLPARARAWALRDQFPDALKGLYPAEEAIDITPDQFEDVTDKAPEEPKTGMDALGDAVAAAKAQDAVIEDAVFEKVEEAKEDVDDTPAEPDEPFTVTEATMLDWKLSMDEAGDEATLESVGLELNGMDDGALKTILRSYYGTRLKEIRGRETDGDSGQPDGGEAR